MTATVAPSSTSILVVDDSKDVLALLHRVLEEHGHCVRVATDGESGLELALEAEPDLVILDVGLPRRNGFEIVQELRCRGMQAPTLMLTARSDVADRITGLEAGADDYLTKPFDSDELIARVRALLRRSSAHGYVAHLRVGDLVLDPVSRHVMRGGRRIALTQREFALLEFFMRNAGRSLSRGAIASHVWQNSPIDADETNVIDVYVAYLRKKIDTSGEPPMLHTVRGVGYTLRAGVTDDG